MPKKPTDPRFIDLEGRQFLARRVVEYLGRAANGHNMWLCRCECGAESKLATHEITKPNPAQCICQKRKKTESALVGKRFGRIFVEGFSEVIEGDSHWNCVCDCGHKWVVMGQSLRSGATQSCGCLMRDLVSIRATKHGKCGSPVYRRWDSMIQRCYNKKFKHYSYYGGRGISVCDRWRFSFEAFFNDMGDPPTNGHTLDRFPNNNGNYELGNCRWATRKEQQRNNRGNCIIEYNGKSQCVSAWADEYGVPRSTIAGRLHRKWSLDRVFSF